MQAMVDREVHSVQLCNKGNRLARLSDRRHCGCYEKHSIIEADLCISLSRAPILEGVATSKSTTEFAHRSAQP